MSAQQTTKNRNIVTIIVAGVIALALLFYLFTFQVRVTERAVITTFGEPTRAINNPGLYWKWPYPFQQKYIFDSRMQIFAGDLEQVFTSDQKSVIVQTFVGWRIIDPRKFLVQVGTPEKAKRSLLDSVRSFTNGVIAQHPFSHLVSENEENPHFAEIESKIQQLLNEGEEGAIANFGIQVDVFGIRSLRLPERTTQTVFTRMEAERERLAEAYRSEGEAQSQIIRSKADAKKREILINAEAEAMRIRGEGDAKAAKFYGEFAQAQELAIWLRKLKSLEKLLGKKTTLVVNPDMVPYDLLQTPEIKEAPEVSQPNSAENSPSQQQGGE